MVMEAQKSHICHLQLETQEACGVVQSESEGPRTRTTKCKGRRRWPQLREGESFLPLPFCSAQACVDWMRSTCIWKSNLYSVHGCKC